MILVLAVTHHVRLLRSPILRSSIPRLLSSAIFQASRRIFRTISRALLMAIALRNLDSPMPLANAFNAVPGLRVEQ